MTAARYWVDIGDLEKGLGTFVYRKMPDTPGYWAEVELAIVPAERRVSHGEEDASDGKSKVVQFRG